MDILLILSVLPAALLFLLVYKNGSGHKESPGMLIKLFLFGCLSAPLAGSLEEAGTAIVSMLGIDSYGQIMYDLVFYILVVAVIEELVKFIFLFTTIDDNRFNYTFDGILYAVMIGLGFATLENIMYVFGTWSVLTAVARGLLAVPLHCTCAVFMGYCFGYARRAKVKGDTASVFGYSLLSLIIPIMIHGIYDFAIENDVIGIAIFGFVFTFVVFVAAFFHLKKASYANELLNAEEPPFTRF